MTRGRRRAAAALAAAVALATLAAFAPVARNGFVNYDDNTVLVGNPHVTGGLTLANVRWAFTTTEFVNWCPAAWLSHQLDATLFGMRPGAHHLMSAALHAANGALLVLLLHALTGALWPSALAGALFALHPLRVESVAWATERRDVLMLLFSLLAVAAYLRFARRRGAGAYAAALALFAAALMAKAMAVTLPGVLLLVDFWPLGRWRRGGRLQLPGAGVLLEKLPFVALSVAAGAVTFLAQRGGGAVAYAVEYPLAHRVPNAFLSCAIYLAKTFWPTRLAVYYPYRWQSVPAWQPALGVLLVAAVTAAALALHRRRPVLAFGWFWYLGTLLPVIGIVQAGSQARADRFTYLPQIGVLVVVAWGLGGAWARLPRLRPALAAAPAVALAALAAATWAQATHWRSSETLFRHALAVTEENAVALTNLGAALADAGRFAEANELIARSLRVNPLSRAEVFARAGDRLAATGQSREAAEQYRRALEIVPYDRAIRRKLEALGGAPAPPAGR